ncbi:cell fate regulator YaaT (PSP1 superfamily) [Breznakibacter xylanolyticus]|uniref:Cell fate regulator YaaT (PSP1 superfamily) n=1 Tax=Breznakibacter xylanolyticus TaxID=990 RepID=A0A2W7NEG5_9BACT|nr:regulatory iron-sulfur-containing complex subunit RicT [Breznakibacter xylanolyticus]PZX18578.1 cell fate regulator YaaT (PSP1 superfamily) [Breznakibacter xylanolyticus]
MQEEILETHDKCTACTSRCNKLEVFDWLSDLPQGVSANDIVEIQFKNTRKGYYRNSNAIHLEKGDAVAVEASPGHDIGEVSLTGELVLMQMKKNNISPASYDFKRIYRKVKPVDIEKWEEAKALEHETMLESRRIASRLKLNMKIGDVEYQGDRTKAIFYYIADERVDFRELIKLLAERFKIRIEMRQIGARQEAGRIGGIGPCGRELCCSTWMTNFVSVTTNSARYQEISLNPQKLAGQCGKLKCCLNYELDAYIDAQQDFPRTNIPLRTREGVFLHFKTDVFKRLMWYTLENNGSSGLFEVSVDRVKEIIAMNRKGIEVDKLIENAPKPATKEIGFHNVVIEESLTRFDDKNRRNRDKRGNNQRNRPQRPGNNPRNNAARDEANDSTPMQSQNPEGQTSQPRENRQPRIIKPQAQNGSDGNPIRRERDNNATRTNQQHRGNRNRPSNRPRGGNQPNNKTPDAPANETSHE